VNKRIISLFAVLIAFACNNAEDKKAETKDTATEIQMPTENTIAVPKLCFQRVVQKDTISIELFIRDTIVSGNLIYNLYEKDRNKGTFKGTIHGETIKADYTYQSEGKISAREIIFKLKDSVLTEGFGETLVKDNKFIFKDTLNIHYTQVFQQVGCK